MLNWRPDTRVRPVEGARGSGGVRGQVGVADFQAGTYPACSNHGALIRLSEGPYWRCLSSPDCNAGAETDLPWKAQ